ncbi:hypothetical protein BH10ACI1_BH10ACI1_04030 [soil metagenome]
MNDGNLLSVFPQVGGNPPPNQFNPPPTMQFGQSSFRSLSETVTVVQPSYTPPTQPPRSVSNTNNKNILIAVLAAVSVLLLVGIFIMNRDKNSSENDNRSSSNTEREGNSSANSNNGNSEDNSSTSGGKSTDRNNIADNDKIRNEDSDISTPVQKPNTIGRSLPNGIGQQYSGASYFPNKTLPLTLSLTRNNQTLYGSAQTPGEWDDLSGTVQPDGSFSLSGYNRNAGRVTGMWRGRITENGQVSGVWTSTDGSSKVRFSAR